MKNLFIALLLLTGTIVSSQENNLMLSSDVWPPFTDKKGEKSISFDIVKEALKRIDINSEFIITDFDSVLSGIDDGKFNGSAALWKSEEREAKLIYSDAYLQNQLILLGRKGSNPNISSLSELKGKRIGLVEGYAYAETSQAENSFEAIYAKSDQENLERLLSEEIDFMLVDDLLIQYLLKYQVNDVSNLLEFASTPLITKPLYFALSKETPNAKEIIAQFNIEIKKMISDGSYNSLLGLNWIRADVDGNGTLELVFTGDEAGVEPPENAYDIFHTENSDSANSYYINGNLYADWNDIPEANRVAQPEINLDMPPVSDPEAGKLRF